MLNLLKEFFGGCAHRRISRPVTLDEVTYCACLECGRHLLVENWRIVARKS
jgi:hypothetical protein